MSGAVEQRFRMLETEVRVRCGDESFAARLATLLAPFVSSPGCGDAVPSFSVMPQGQGRQRLTRGTASIAEGSDEVVTARLVAALNVLALRSCRHLASHSGVVALGDAAVAFPAASGGGKSTLTAACVQAGFAYVSDEALCVDHVTGLVVPYQKPLSLSCGTLERLGLAALGNRREEALLRAEDLGGSLSQGDLRLGHVVLMKRTGGPPRLVELPRPRVVTAVLEFAFNHYRDPGGSFRVAVEAARGCRAWCLFHDDPCRGAALLRSRLGA